MLTYTKLMSKRKIREISAGPKTTENREAKDAKKTNESKAV